MMGRSWMDKSSQISSGSLKFCKSCWKRPQSGHFGKRVAGRGYLETFASTAGPGQPAWVWKPWFASARSKVLETQWFGRSSSLLLHVWSDPQRCYKTGASLFCPRADLYALQPDPHPCKQAPCTPPFRVYPEPLPQRFHLSPFLPSFPPSSFLQRIWGDCASSHSVVWGPSASDDPPFPLPASPPLLSLWAELMFWCVCLVIFFFLILVKYAQDKTDHLNHIKRYSA